MRISIYFRWCIASALILGISLFCLAQDGSPTGPQALPSFVGQRVSSVDLAGQPGVTAKTVPDLIAVQEGQPLTEQKVNTTIAALKRSGRFQNVELDLRPQSDGVRVMFILQPAIYLGIYEFPGAETVFPYSRLLQVANYPSQEPFSQVDVEQARAALVQFFHQRGFFLATVRPEVQVDYTHRLANVLFHTELGRRAKVGEITFTGAPAEETQELEAKLRSFMARVEAAYLKPGKPYRYARLQRATRYRCWSQPPDGLDGAGFQASDPERRRCLKDLAVPKV